MNVVSKEFLKNMQNLINNRTEENTKIFEDCLKNEKFLCPVVLLNDDAEKKINDENTSVVSLQDASGEWFFVIFTDYDKFNVFIKDNPFVDAKIGFLELQYLLTHINKEAKGIVLNIKDEALLLPREAILDIK